jgi:hypothetical protein
LLRPPPDDFQWSFTVKLPRDEVRLLRQTIESFRDRVFQDKDHTPGCHLLAGGQITSEPRQT